MPNKNIPKVQEGHLRTCIFTLDTAINTLKSYLIIFLNELQAGNEIISSKKLKSNFNKSLIKIALI